MPNEQGSANPGGGEQGPLSCLPEASVPTRGSREQGCPPSASTPPRGLPAVSEWGYSP